MLVCLCSYFFCCVPQACEGALKRLGMDYIDLFTLRGPAQPGVDIGDVMQELKVCVQTIQDRCHWGRIT